MELKYLITFKTILESGSFLKAARKLNYTQSTITFQIQQLEKELSVKLFEKIGRRMVVTKAGSDIVPYVDAVLQAVEQLENQGKGYDTLIGTLRVAIAETLLTYKMQPVLKAFREQAPGVKLSVQSRNCYEIRDEMIKGSIDLGVHYDVGGYGDSIIAEELSQFPLALLASPDLEKGEYDFTTPGYRNNIALITNDENGIYQKILEEYLSKKQIVLEGIMDLGNVETVKGCVESNLGIALMPRFAAEKQLEQGTLQELEIDLDPCTCSLTAVCSHHKNKWITPAMELFVRLTKETLTKKE